MSSTVRRGGRRAKSIAVDLAEYAYCTRGGVGGAASHFKAASTYDIVVRSVL